MDARGREESEEAADDTGTAATAGTGPGEAGVGIPKQPSADEAADSETGENARK
ncbi:gliding motility protein [Streptomyces sp. NPDC007083]|uniref:gliding motility protein n=1 Tax=unclassified Streptomyces TaxID=2593676 RepID=UPI0033C4CD94